MQTKQIGSRVENGKFRKLSVPPGFVSLTSFSLRRVENNEDASEPEPAQMDLTRELDVEFVKKSVRHRPWILYDESNVRTRESESVQLDKVNISSLFDSVVRDLRLSNIFIYDKVSPILKLNTSVYA